MKTVVPSATRRAMYNRAISVQKCLDCWLERLGQLAAEQTPPPKENPEPLEFLRGKPKPEAIVIPYKDFERMVGALGEHSEAIKKLRKPVVQRPVL